MLTHDYSTCRHEYIVKAGSGRYGPRKRCMFCGRSFDDPSPNRVGKRRVKPVTAKEITLIASMHRNGQHVNRIVAATGLARVTVFRWIKKINAAADIRPKLLMVITF